MSGALIFGIALAVLAVDVCALKVADAADERGPIGPDDARPSEAGETGANDHRPATPDAEMHKDANMSRAEYRSFEMWRNISGWVHKKAPICEEGCIKGSFYAGFRGLPGCVHTYLKPAV